ncbi:hypothetical protein PSACC_02276 [Paramicrosporidium saccamoebae]|uniref:Uncharacterized protein n=1 Tax=Paramicrosporidium saccamoebae TaxID=1246581 RepID=A0A2H9TJN6_9FUNG|nr:hypothetical protein PSACC_02276 [Paramicrosporidium saccamoebae]
MTFRPSEELSLTLAKRGASGEEDVHSGDITCSLLVDRRRYSPTFTTTNAETGKVTACSRWFAFFNHVNPGAVEHGHATELSKFVESAHGPGTTSNGRALLPFTADLSHLPKNQRIHIVGMKYLMSSGSFMPTLALTGSIDMLKFFATHCRQWYNVMNVKWICSTSIYSNGHVPTPEDETFNSKTSDIMSLLLHVRSVSLSLREKAAFLATYYRK